MLSEIDDRFLFVSHCGVLYKPRIPTWANQLNGVDYIYSWDKGLARAAM